MGSPLPVPRVRPRLLADLPLLLLLLPSAPPAQEPPAREVQDRRVEDLLARKQAAYLARAAREEPASLRFGWPGPSMPCFHAAARFPAALLPAGGFLVERVLLDGVAARDVRLAAGPEIVDGRVPGGRELEVAVRLDWTPGEEHEIAVSGKSFARAGEEEPSGPPVLLSLRAAVPADSPPRPLPAWRRYLAVVAAERAGLAREGEPVHLTLALFADQVGDPAREIRVVRVDGPGRWVELPCQATDRGLFAEPGLCANPERDAKTGEQVVRYHATRTFDLCFPADLGAFGEAVFLVFHGNPLAPAPAGPTPLKVAGAGFGLVLENDLVRWDLDRRSGHVERVLVKQGLDILLEHKLETNGAVHWNPGCYAPPDPWVHASDWDPPESARVERGPLFVRTVREGPLPGFAGARAGVRYTFYGHKPWLEVHTTLRVVRDLFVQALRNGEVVFNHAVLDEFAWPDGRGIVRAMAVAGSRRHPEHALRIPADTPWWCLCSRGKEVGFGMVNAEAGWLALDGGPPALEPPFIYVANGPWVYVSRALVYPFGSNNPTRLAAVRREAVYTERMLFLPYRLPGGDPFAPLAAAAARSRNPLALRVAAPTDPRTPRSWVAPILVAPFDEGVKGAVGGRAGAGEGER